MGQAVTLAARPTKAERKDSGAASAHLRCSDCRATLGAVLEENILAGARLRAAALERAAEERAQALLAAARKEAEEIRRKAAAAGREEGYHAGYEAGKAAAQDLIREAEARRAAVEEERAERLAALEPEVLDLAFALARRILHREVRTAPADVEDLLAAAAAKLAEGAEVTIQVAPGESDAWHEARDVVQEALGDRPYRLEENTNVPAGEFLLTSAGATVDARLESQLAACREQLTEAGHAAAK